MNNNVVLSNPASPPTTGLYFCLNGLIHLPGDSVSITDIGSNVSLGDAGNSLVCVTSNVNTKCCRMSDGGNVGEWYHPNGTIVPRNIVIAGDDIFTRTAFTQQVRLNRRVNAVGPLGVYRCDVPADPSGANISASITIRGQGVSLMSVLHILCIAVVSAGLQLSDTCFIEDIWFGACVSGVGGYLVWCVCMWGGAGGGAGSDIHRMKIYKKFNYGSVIVCLNDHVLYI